MHFSIATAEGAATNTTSPNGTGPSASAPANIASPAATTAAACNGVVGSSGQIAGDGHPGSVIGADGGEALETLSRALSQVDAADIFPVLLPSVPSVAADEDAGPGTVAAAAAAAAAATAAASAAAASASVSNVSASVLAAAVGAGPGVIRPRISVTNASTMEGEDMEVPDIEMPGVVPSIPASETGGASVAGGGSIEGVVTAISAASVTAVPVEGPRPRPTSPPGVIGGTGMTARRCWGRNCRCAREPGAECAPLSLPGSVPASREGHIMPNTGPSGRAPQATPRTDDGDLEAVSPALVRPPGVTDDDAELAQQFLCPICLEVCTDAVETPCCNNLFCAHCLLSEKHHITNCPICKRVLQAAHVVANVPVRRFISDLPCKCRFDGCSVSMRRRDRLRHEAQCDFLPVRCRYSSECPPLLQGQLAQHEASECRHRPVPCPLGCECITPYNLIDEHLETECPRVLMSCDYCHEPICRGDMTEHVCSICPLAPVMCGFAEDETQDICEQKCERRHMAAHQRECPLRPMSCQHDGCTQVTTYRLLASHQASCSWRQVECPDCGQAVRMRLLQEHLDHDCPEHQVLCPFSCHGCTELIPRRLVSEHLSQACGAHLAQLCSAVALRDAEILNLRSEMVQMRNNFEHRLASLEGGGGSFTVPAGSGSIGSIAPPHAASAQHNGQEMPISPRATTAGSQMSHAPLPRAAVPQLMGNISQPSIFLPGVEQPRAADMFPGPAREREPGLTLPNARQPVALLREGGISQVPVLLPPRSYSAASSTQIAVHPMQQHFTASGARPGQICRNVPRAWVSSNAPPPPPSIRSPADRYSATYHDEGLPMPHVAAPASTASAASAAAAAAAAAATAAAASVTGPNGNHSAPLRAGALGGDAAEDRITTASQRPPRHFFDSSGAGIVALPPPPSSMVPPLLGSGPGLSQAAASRPAEIAVQSMPAQHAMPAAPGATTPHGGPFAEPPVGPLAAPPAGPAPSPAPLSQLSAAPAPTPPPPAPPMVPQPAPSASPVPGIGPVQVPIRAPEPVGVPTAPVMPSATLPHAMRAAMLAAQPPPSIASISIASEDPMLEL